MELKFDLRQSCNYIYMEILMEVRVPLDLLSPAQKTINTGVDTQESGSKPV